MMQPKRTKFRKQFKGRSRVAPGRVMFELDGVPEDVAREALRLGAAKLSVKTRFIQRIAE